MRLFFLKVGFRVTHCSWKKKYGVVVGDGGGGGVGGNGGGDDGHVSRAQGRRWTKRMTKLVLI